METLTNPARTAGWLVRLCRSWLFRGKATLPFHRRTPRGLVSELVGWCFKSSQPQRITSGLNTNFTLSPSHSFYKSSYHKSCLFFLAYLYSTGTLHGNLHPAGRPFLFCGLTQDSVLATANTGRKKNKKTGEVLEQMRVNGPEGEK